MPFFKLIILFFCFHIFSVCAASVDCELSGQQSDWVSIHTDFELKPANVKMTIGANIPDWQIIYEMDNVVIGKVYTTCNSYYNAQYSILNARNVAGTFGGDTIYETDVPGIGMSITKGTASLPVYPAAFIYDDYPGQGYTYTISKIKFWKIPGKTIPLSEGTISVTGPEVGGLIGIASNAAMTTSSGSERILNTQYPHFINSSRVLHATLIFQPGTCNIEGDDIKVEMGSFDDHGLEHSVWKDASFKLICPDAYGYNGSADAKNDGDNPYNLSPDANITANSIKNGRVTISIVPYTDVVDANKGIIALDGTGATGYGIQLAWGDYSSQNSVEPTNPVILNSSIDANSLNSAFLAGDTPIGGNAFTGGDNTIKMAARYIRTTGETAPGPANAIVQVIANYQ